MTYLFWENSIWIDKFTAKNVGVVLINPKLWKKSVERDPGTDFISPIDAFIKRKYKF